LAPTLCGIKFRYGGVYGDSGPVNGPEAPPHVRKKRGETARSAEGLICVIELPVESCEIELQTLELMVEE